MVHLGTVEEGFNEIGRGMAIHPAQVPIINEVFTPSPEEIARARAVVAAFDANPGKGALAVGGVMHDRPHLARAQRLLAHAAGAEKSL